MKFLFEIEKQLCQVIFGTFETNLNTLENTKKGYVIRSNGYQMFFITLVPVPPNRFRPENKMGDQTFLHSHTLMLTKIITINNDLKKYIVEQTINQKKGRKPETEQERDHLSMLVTGTGDPTHQQKTAFIKKHIQLSDVVTKWIDLQDSVNTFFDSTKAS